MLDALPNMRNLCGKPFVVIEVVLMVIAHRRTVCQPGQWTWWKVVAVPRKRGQKWKKVAQTFSDRFSFSRTESVDDKYVYCMTCMSVVLIITLLPGCSELLLNLVWLTYNKATKNFLHYSTPMAVACRHETEDALTTCRTKMMSWPGESATYYRQRKAGCASAACSCDQSKSSLVSSSFCSQYWSSSLCSWPSRF